MVIKNNNRLPIAHFRKSWQRHVKTWFHQSAQKTSRRYKRNVKLTSEAPRPVGLLRPVVHPPSRKHNMKHRLGRGFSIDELKKIGVSRKVASTIGIAVDVRRRNKSEESLAFNSERLRQYMANLVVFPRKTKLRKGFGGMPNDTSKEELSKYKSMAIAKLMPVPQPSMEIEARAITEADRHFNAFVTLQKARYDGKKNYKKVRKEALHKKMFDERVAKRE